MWSHRRTGTDRVLRSPRRGSPLCPQGYLRLCSAPLKLSAARRKSLRRVPRRLRSSKRPLPEPTCSPPQCRGASQTLRDLPTQRSSEVATPQRSPLSSATLRRCASPEPPRPLSNALPQHNPRPSPPLPSTRTATPVRRSTPQPSVAAPAQSFRGHSVAYRALHR